jgi:hypothetical protein
MNGVDAIIFYRRYRSRKFSYMRKLVCNDMDYLNSFDEAKKWSNQKNSTRKLSRKISKFHHSKNLSDSNWMKKM